THQIDHQVPSTSKELLVEGAKDFDSTLAQFQSNVLETTDQESAKLCETYQIDHQVPSTSKELLEEGAKDFDSTLAQFQSNVLETTDQESAKLCETYQIDYQSTSKGLQEESASKCK